MSSRSSTTTSSPTWRATSQTGTPAAASAPSQPPGAGPRSREAVLSAATAERRSSPVTMRTPAPGGGGAPRGRSTSTTSCSARMASRTASAHGRGPPRTSPVRTGMACHTGRAPTRWPGRKADSSAGRSAQRSPVRTLCPHRRSRPPVGSRSIIATRLPARPSAHARCSSRTLAPRPPRAPVTASTWPGRLLLALPAGADAGSGTDGGSDGERYERLIPGIGLLSPVCDAAPGCTGSPAEGLRGGKDTSRPSHTGLRPVAGPPRVARLVPAPSVAPDVESFSPNCGAAASPDAATAGMVSVSSDHAGGRGSCGCPGCHAPSPAGTGACLTGISTGIALSFRLPHCLPGPAHSRPLPRPLPQPPSRLPGR